MVFVLLLLLKHCWCWIVNFWRSFFYPKIDQEKKMESSSNIGSSSNCESEATNESSSENCREDEEIIIIPVDEIDENEEKGKEVGQAVEMELFNKWKSKDVETRIDTSHLPTFPIEFKRLDASKSSSTNNTNNSSNSNSSLLTKSYSKNAAERLVIPANHPTPPPGSLYASIRQVCLNSILFFDLIF